MTGADQPGVSPWDYAVWAATLFAVDPAGTGGVRVRAGFGPMRDRWLALAHALLPASTPARRIHCSIADDRLLGGLDLAATLQTGRPIAQRGILSEVDGGVLTLAMAERVSPALAARLGIVLDRGEVIAERDGHTLRTSASFGVVALDEGIDEERPPSALLDRFAFQIDLDDLSANAAVAMSHHADDVIAARTRLSTIDVGDDVIRAICEACMQLGIASIRAPLLALRAARAAAALAGRSAVSQSDISLSAALVLAPRATVLPMPEPSSETDATDNDTSGAEGAAAILQQGAGDDDPSQTQGRPLGDIVLDAAQAAIPSGLLEQLRVSVGGRVRAHSSGRAGALRSSVRQGRPAGVRQGVPRAGARLNILETLRAAAPWQALRRREGSVHSGSARIEVRREDFRVTHLKQRAETTTIFAVDASGSSALNRLAEAKGAVELLLADCYVRRDRVALLAFRGLAAELVLPPTRSLARAKRSLAALPGGGGTPLATAIDAAAALADAARRKGHTPTIVILTDGRANVARDGRPGREQAEPEALAAARAVRAAGVTALIVDTSPRPHPSAQRLAAEMDARYLPLPYADAKLLSQAVQATSAQSRRGPTLSGCE